MSHYTYSSSFTTVKHSNIVQTCGKPLTFFGHSYCDINNQTKQGHIPENKDEFLQQMFLCISDNNNYDIHSPLSF